MSFKSLAGALGALLLFVTPALAQTSSGRARGAWDLPTADHAGEVHGILFNRTGRLFELGAKLTPFPLPDGRRGGRIEGLLAPAGGPGLSRPIAEVHGTYSVGPDGRGRFEALIVKPTSDGIRPEPIGKIAGIFADPMAGKEDPIGRFLASWALRH